MNEQLNETLMSWVTFLNTPLWDFLVIFLVGVGIFYTLITGAVQIRLFWHSIKAMRSSRKKGEDSYGITPFQALVTGLASRVGVGNVAGVAIAIAIGGPGAVFWMWFTAFLGMSSAFVESSLAQLFKVRDTSNQQFRGGPAYYITQGLKQKWLGVVFAVALILTYGFVFNAVQANSIISATSHAWGWNQANLTVPMGAFSFELSWLGLVLVVMTAMIIFGGIKRIAKVAEKFVPIMALLYLVVALYIAVINIPIIPDIFRLIFSKAFEFDAAAGGFFGAMVSMAMMMGIKRGLFSNEAGMGSVPNAAAVSDVKHPVNQGLVQMLGVFVDTFIVCSCTAIIILSSGLYQNAGFEGVTLTQMALESQIGHWGDDFLAIILFMFAYSSIIGNYAYAEGNVQFINNNRKIMLIFRLLVLFMVYFGAIATVPLIWSMADLFMGVMATINLFAILLLTPFVLMLLKDFKAQLKRGVKEPEFKLDNHPKFKDRVNSDIW
ncbi:alanine:cation symporter family protein [Acinetobacter indicus]|uniref:alanine/glycine:cation symporter family protein n=1 Tax=Acinetobacter indicus TaxID=756892 RepID=UPI000CEC2409|nr:alanine/glycine:cation symporter family protein [Acinetobacter indicus]MDM1310334.1 alanine:cation symporter family protein [Acinetobacter indicus]QIC79578.1 alanine:cation symporter family protein [Acinetobacter indicus]QLB60063.1 alanine:cation symporter family protein [Acinetobacter indicus]